MLNGRQHAGDVLPAETRFCVSSRRLKHNNNELFLHWIENVLRPRQHSIGYIGDGFYRSKDQTNSIKVLKEKATKESPENANNKIPTQIRNSTC